MAECPTDSLASAGCAGCLQETLAVELARPPRWSTYHHTTTNPVWGLLVQAILRTRAYDVGIAVAFKLLSETELYRPKLGERLYGVNLAKLYTMVLSMLDRSDQWEAYLSAWQSIREHTHLSMLYGQEALEEHGERIVPYTLGQDDNGLHVHFLYCQDHRKECIERKLAMGASGGSVGHLYHGRQEDLTAGEIEQRLEDVREQAVRLGVA